MANQSDINRWKKGKDHWNKWAEGCLAAKVKLEKDGKWAVDRAGVATNAETKRWINSATTDFSGHFFEAKTDFSAFVFPHEVTFAVAEFRHRADFSGAKFCGSAYFRDATFRSVARFNSARFCKAASFRRTTFSGNAWFIGSRFKEKSVFSEATFDKTANFSESKFFGLASFNWVQSTGSFSLADALFAEVPDFTQTSFRAPVRLDNLRVPQARPFKLKGHDERAAYYRALKKIAIESHDHLRELNFFASEIRERRCNDDPWWHIRYWVGFFYELSSGFGRSILLPLAWLFASFVGFAYLYGRHAPDGCMPDSAWPDTRFLAEFYLSFLNSLPLVGFARAHGRDLAEKCLFGSSEAIKPTVDIVFIGQNIWSALLIFLVLLAVRNHFRIK
ncbi:MAG: pentapeptide repeat-containing protein [Hyphomicrobiales bacterium]|nr:pentapeptide repeat-containing protein [Hyphomicrobiales bacterium]